MQVPLKVAFHGLDKSDAVETRIREKVNKLERYFDRITGCRVVLAKHHSSRTHLNTNAQPFHVSVFLEVPGGELVVDRDPKDRNSLKDHEDVNIALRDAFAAMERQLKEYVSKRWRDVHPEKALPIVE